MKNCPSGTDEVNCIFMVDNSTALNRLLFPVTMIVFVIVTVCVLCLRGRKQRARLTRRRVPTLSMRFAQMAAFARRRQPEIYDDPPPPYPHDNPIVVTQGESEEPNGRLDTNTATPAPSGENKEIALPPSYSDVMSGIYIQIVPGQVTNDNDCSIK